MGVNLIIEAYKDLFDEIPHQRFTIKYSRAFTPYNANVKYTKEKIDFKLSHYWKDTSDEIKKGLIQSLLLKIFKKKKKTFEIDLYEIFLQNAHIGIEKDNIDPYLKELFEKINGIYFENKLEMPNLTFGGKNLTKLGSYNFSSDTIMISEILKKEPMLLEYVLYHEMLHKRLKFKRSGSKHYHHTKEFKDMEKEFYLKDAEKKLRNFLRKEKIKRAFFMD